MSSPEILEVHPLPDESTRSRHRQLARHHLDQARGTIGRLKEEVDAILRCGGNPAEDLRSIDEVESAIEALSNQGDGSIAVARAEEYLRHVQAAEVVLRKRRARLEAETSYLRELQAIAHRESERLANLSSKFAPSELKLRELTREAGGGGPGTPHRTAADIEDALAAILASVKSDEERRALIDRLEGLARLPARERLIQFDTLRSALELQTKRRLLARAAQIERGRRASAVGQLAAKEFADLDAAIAATDGGDKTTLRSALSALRKETPDLDESTFLSRVNDLRRQVEAAQRRQRILGAVVHALRIHGFEAADGMNTLTSEDIQSMLLRDSRDPDRMVEVQCSGDRGLVSAEVVRCQDSNGTQRERQLDLESQERLCAAMRSANDTLATTFSVKVRSRTPPGKPVKLHPAAAAARRTGRRAAISDRSKSAKP